MTSKQRKHLANIIGICGVLTMLWGCQKNTETIDSTNTIQITKPTSTTDIQASITKDTESIEETSTKQQISINNRCVWCGKCAIIAPETFTLQGRRAEVISQKQVTDNKTQQAIRKCPKDAIEIIEV